MKHLKFPAHHALLTLLLATAPCAIVFADAPDDQYKQASELYSAKLYTTAAQELKKFLDANPTHPQAKIAAYQWASAIYRADKGKDGPDYAAAAAAYEWALQKYPTADAKIVSAARFELGEAYYYLEKPDKVISILTEFLKNPGVGDDATNRAAWANYYIGQGYFGQKKYPEAKAAYERVRDNYAQSEPAPDAIMELGLMSLDSGQAQAAITAFQTVVDKYPKADAVPEARVRLGDANLAAKKYPEARAAYQAAMADAKAGLFKSDVALGMADADFAEKKYPEAAQGYAQVLGAMKADNPRRATVQLRQGNSFYNAKNYQAAVGAYAPLLASANADLAAPALYFTAGAQAAQKQFAPAAANYQKLLDAFPTHALAPKAALRMGDAWAEAKNPAQAAQAYKIVLTKYDKSDAAKEAQEALADLAGTAGAGAAVESALRDLPAGIAGNAKLRLAQNAFDAADWAKAAQLAQGIADSKPDAATGENALYLVATAKLNNKDAVGAAEAYRKLVAAYPQGKLSGEARLGLAWSLEDQKKWPEAEAAARAALAGNLSGDLKTRAQLTLAGALYNGAKYADAVTAFAAVEAATDKTFASQAAQGGALALEKQNLWPQAAGRWAKYAALSGDAKTKSEALFRQASALNKAKDPGALAAFDAAIAADPKGDFAANALYEGAWLLHDAKSPDEAARWARLETEFPTAKLAPEAVFQQGELALAAQKWDDAANAYRRMTTKYPQSDLGPRANYQLGTALYQAQKWAEAAPAFDKSAAATKERFAIEAPFWAGESYRRAGNLKDAATRYETFVKNVEGGAAIPADLKTYLPSARLGWGQSVNDAAQAAQIYQPALAGASGKTKTELSFRLGEALSKQGKYQDAIVPLISVATGAPDSEWGAQAQWLAAEALEKTGAKGDAVALYRKLAERQPATDLTAKAQAKAKELE